MQNLIKVIAPNPIDDLLELLKSSRDQMEKFREEHGGFNMETDPLNAPNGTMASLFEVQTEIERFIEWLEDPNTYDPG